jgi:hypothetical protein
MPTQVTPPKQDKAVPATLTTASKRPYHPPQFTHLGTIVELTQGGRGGGSEPLAAGSVN